MRNFFRDFRYGARVLIKRPGFTFIAVFTIALGIGANTAILSVVNGFILRPLPVERPDELVTLYWGSRKSAEVWNDFSYPNYLDLRDQNRTLSGLIAWNMTSAGISDGGSRTADATGGRAEIIWGECVSGNYFDVLGVRAKLGRTFLPEEDLTPDSHPVAVLGDAFWRRRFNSDPAIVGKTIYLNGNPFTVIGVAPNSFGGVKFAINEDFWVPLMMANRIGAFGADWRTDRSLQNLTLLGRLKPGTTSEQAEADLDLIAQSLANLYPKTNADSKIQLVSEVEGRFGDAAGFFRFAGVVAIAVACLVLLVACANVANLLLSRSASRAREIAIRLAIGASRLQIVRQLLVESLLLASMGAVLGLLFAFWGADLVHASIPPLPYPVSLDFRPDLRVLRWMLVISVMTGLVFGLMPALMASRTDLVGVLKGEISGKTKRMARRWSLRNLLVVAQVAISIVVLVCAGLFVRSLNRVKSADPGFNIENLLTVRLAPGLLNYGPAEGRRFFQELVTRIERHPGVRAASLVMLLPLGDSNSQRGPIVREGDPAPLPGEGLWFDANVVTPKYFETMQTPLVLGRDFTEHDDENAPRVAIVNQEFARRMYGSEENALGKRFWERGPNTALLEIIGVARDGRYVTLYEKQRPYIFVPENQEYQSEMTLLVSCTGPAEMRAMAEGVRREIGQLDSRVPTFALQIGEMNLAFAYWGPKLAAGLAIGFGLLALLLATMGLYSVITYDVSRRTREIGIRMALGAQVRDVLKIVVRQGMSMVLVGTVIGVTIAFAFTRALASLLFEIGATDLLTFGGVSLLLVLIALVACYVPARRAAKVRPMSALRYE